MFGFKSNVNHFTLRLRNLPEDIKRKTLTIHCPNKRSKLLLFLKMGAPNLEMSGNDTAFKEKYEIIVARLPQLRTSPKQNVL